MQKIDISKQKVLIKLKGISSDVKNAVELCEKAKN